MRRETESSLFIGSPLAKYAEFYQHLLKGIGDYNQSGNRLIAMGEKAHSSRQFDKVKEIGLTLRSNGIGQLVTTSRDGGQDFPASSGDELFKLILDSLQRCRYNGPRSGYLCV